MNKAQCKWHCRFKKEAVPAVLGCDCVMRMRSHQSRLETPTTISSLPFLKSDWKPATRLLLNYSLKSDVWAVNRVRFHTDRRGVQVLIPSAGWARFTQHGEEPSRYAGPWQVPGLTGTHTGTREQLIFCAKCRFPTVQPCACPSFCL